MSISTKAKLLTEKGKVRTEVRKTLQKKVEAKPEIFLKAEKVDTGVYEMPVKNTEGEVVYIRFEVKVSEKSAKDLAPKVKKPKASNENEPIEIE